MSFYQPRKRNRLAAESEWGHEVYLYAWKFFARNEWRVVPLNNIDDMMQDAYIMFLDLTARYEFSSKEHFFGMWRKCLRNYVASLASKRMRRGDVLFSQLPDGALDCHATASGKAEAEWELHKREAPPEVRQLLDAVEQQNRRRRSRRFGCRRETTDSLLRRMAGVPSSVPMRRIFECWLNGVPQEKTKDK